MERNRRYFQVKQLCEGVLKQGWTQGMVNCLLEIRSNNVYAWSSDSLFSTSFAF